eukprot:12171957-Alexandrium_andersonii.AAC.1
MHEIRRSSRQKQASCGPEIAHADCRFGACVVALVCCGGLWWGQTVLRSMRVACAQCLAMCGTQR